MATDVTHHCGTCHKPATACCGECKDIYYCSVGCQKKDWRMHKTICSSAANLAPRPSKRHRRAILLPVEGTGPEFVWMATELAEDDDHPAEESDESEDPNHGSKHIHEVLKVPWADPPGTSWACADPVPFLRSPDSTEGHVSRDLKQVVIGTRGGGEHLDHGIWLTFRDAMRVDGSKPNQTLMSLTKNQSYGSFWKGPLLFYGGDKAVDTMCTMDLHSLDLKMGLNGLTAWYEACFRGKPDLTTISIHPTGFSARSWVFPTTE